MKASTPPSDEVTAEEIAAIEKVLQHIDQQNAKRAALGPLANWLLALRIYKGVEMRFVCMKERAHLEQAHRTMLCSILALGEFLLMVADDLSDADLKSINLSKAAVLANVKYLRAKHAQWYGKRDAEQVRSTIAAMESAGA